MRQEILQKLKEKLNTAGKNEFAVQVEETYCTVREEARKNRDKHFSIQNRILYCSAGVSLVNVLVTLCSSFGWLQGLVPVFTAVSSAISVVVTVMIAVKGSKKYSETWRRHQIHQADMEFEMLEYVCESGKYQTGTDADKAEAFVDAVLGIWKKNQERFNNNMASFDKE